MGLEQGGAQKGRLALQLAKLDFAAAQMGNFGVQLAGNRLVGGHAAQASFELQDALVFGGKLSLEEGLSG